MMNPIPKRKIISYLVLPQLKDRFKNLFASGFRYIPFFVALVYQSVRILPANHPYVDSTNIGNYGLRHVIAEAANNIKLSRSNIDQILVFGLILMGMGLLAMQIFTMVFGIVIEPALAFADPMLTNYFRTDEPHQDLAFMMMDLVFGMPPDMFGSCVSNAAVDCINTANVSISGKDTSLGALIPDYPSPAHVGLHQMFQVYSLGLLVVAVFITCYFIITIIAETAQTGTPMGKRFNKVWAPIRIVAALGLLVPLGSGLNSAQYIVLHAAKLGSGFATNGWVLFNETLSERYTEGVEDMLVATPQTPEVGVLLQFMYTARTCYEIHKARFSEHYAPDTEDKRKQVAPYLVGNPLSVPKNMAVLKPQNFDAKSYSGNGGEVNNIKATLPYDQMIGFQKGNNIVTLRFGLHDPEAYPAERGNVKPVCGELKFTLEDTNMPEDGAGATEPYSEKGPEILQRYYWFVIKELWFTNAVFDVGKNYPLHYVNDDTDNGGVEAPPASVRTRLQSFYSRDLHSVLTGEGIVSQVLFQNDGAVIEHMKSNRWNVDDSLKKRGWGGASIWYNKIAEMNGPLTGAVFNVPLPSRYPDIMEYVKQKRFQYDESVPMNDRFSPTLGDNRAIPFPNQYDSEDARRLNEAFQYWTIGGFASSSHSGSTGNPIIDVINALLGTDGLFSMRDNANVHPLAQIVGIGKSLVDSSIRNLGIAGIGGLGGALMGAANLPSVQAVIGVVNGFVITITMIGLTAGFIMFYIVPFLPFIYFFFALGGWVKGIFEAMVGAPLWALAHIRIDGDGLSGKAAASGYYLIFEVFVRPILIIFGFLASITTFSATVSVLNNIFDLVVQNVAGHDVSASQDAGWGDIEYYRAPVDEFFYTIIYAIIVYLLGMASFKLIDQIPNSILRWMGQSTQTFNDSRENPAEKMVGTATIGAQQTLDKMGKGLEGLNDALTKPKPESPPPRPVPMPDNADT